MLKAVNLFKSYGQLPILKNINVSFAENEMVAIVGPSGAGKSTLLHLLGTLDTADSGSILFNNKDLSKLKAKELNKLRNKEFVFIFQFHHLLPEFSAIENVCIPGWIAEQSMSQTRKRAAELLEIVGLSHRLEHKPSELSGGEQQRVAIARALMNNAKVIFADEPTGNLDTQNALQVNELFKELKREFKQTFIIVTHNEELAKSADRIIHMKDGEII
ncbi:MAG: ABC transporter ATP-binding protein [bacterium]